MKKMGLHELISLTFDSDPHVRKQAAVELAKYDAPGAMFALVELTYDKDRGVRETVSKLLEELKANNSEPELMSFAEVFRKGKNGEKKKEEEKEPEEKKVESVKEKMLRPIEKMFEKKLGKEKAEEMKKRMMPTIEKMYIKAMKTEGEGENGESTKAVQEMLSGYLDVVAGSEELKEGVEEEEEDKEVGQQSLADELGLVSSKEVKPEAIFKEVEVGALEDEAALMDIPTPEEKWMLEKPEGESASGQTVFKLAFDTMMASKGDEKVMKKAMKKMLKNTEDQIKMAFDVAKKRYTEVNITNITELKSGMKNISTGTLYVKNMEHKDYQRTKTKKDTFTRIVVADQEGNEGVVYLFEQRGAPIRPGMKLKIEKGFAKTYDWSGETAMTVSKKGKIYIIL
ncbi:MAG: HEAT repeat domain-containing protein [bacterium]|nr:HEAT repeat domain-containing protein [bacterium]